MSEAMGQAETLWRCLKDDFPGGATGPVLAEALGWPTNRTCQTLYALGKRNAVIPSGTDEHGHAFYKADPKATFRRPRADKAAPARRASTKRAAKKLAYPATPAPRVTPAQESPHSRFAVDGTWHVLVNDGERTIRIAPDVALAMRDFIDQLAPALEAAK